MRFEATQRTFPRFRRRVRLVMLVACIAGFELPRVPAGLRGAEPPLHDITTGAGIAFQHTIGDDQMTNIVEASGVGCALFDYDGDGWIDLYLVNGCYVPGVSDPQHAPAAGTKPATDRLYRNVKGLRFSDITDRAGVIAGGYGMGVTAGDYDNDGRTDLYVTNYGPNRLYHNRPAGKFEEVASVRHVADDRFGVGAMFADFDGDARLDLLVGNYLEYDHVDGRSGDFPGPSAYPEQTNVLFRNVGEGPFEDVTERAGLATQSGHTMGVAAWDYNNDGRLDLFIANDAMENYLYENQGNGTFQEAALLANVAYGANGDARGAMGAEVGDLTGDGQLDLFVPDFTSTCAYINLGDGFYEDRARRLGISVPCDRFVSWGAVLLDIDLDTDLDIYVANGDARQLRGHQDLLLLNDGRGRFTDASEKAGLTSAPARVSRGVAAGDLDNDGDLDLVVMHLNAPPAVLQNNWARAGRHWLLIQLEGNGTSCTRDAIGAVVHCRIRTTGGQTKTLVRQRVSAGSYLSVHDPRLHFGLGSAEQVERLEITWPDGSKTTKENVAADQILVVKQ